jgi:hypothetical protein
VVGDVQEQGDVTISRDERGRVASIVVDASRPELNVLDLITQEFGSEIADLMSEPPDDEVDEVVTIGDTPGSGLVRGDSPRSRAAVTLLPNEPGVPVPRWGGSFIVSIEIGSSSVDGSVVHDRVESMLHIRIDVPVDDEPLWVRVAEGETGAILALAPLEESDGDTAEVDVPFGLAVPLPTLHFSVSREPLDDPGERTDRRARWARRLEAKARSRRLRSDGALLFERAADVYTSLGDDVAAERCRSDARRARRRRRFLGGAGLVVAAMAFFAIGSRLGGSNDDVVSTVDAAPVTTVPATVPPPTLPDVPPQPGPVDMVFDDGNEAQMLVTGDVIVEPGDELVVVVRTRVSSSITFLTRADCVRSEGGNSLVTGDGPMYQPRFVPRLVNVSDPSAGARALTPFAVDREADTYFVEPGACDRAWVEDGVLFDADAVANYTPYTARLTLPDDLAPGAWELHLVLENVDGVSSTGEYVTIVVPG